MQAATCAHRFGPSPNWVGVPAYCFTARGPSLGPGVSCWLLAGPVWQCCRPAVEITGYDIGGPGPEACPAPHWRVTALSGFQHPIYKVSSWAE